MDPTLPRTIVVPTDFSEHAEKATRYALELAKRLDARLELVHAWSVPIVSYPDLMVPLPATFIDDVGRDAQQRMDKALARTQAPGIAVSGTVVCGDARQALIELADQRKADLIVMGTHGRRGVKRALMGSVAEAVVRHAHCPVLVVR
jgi:nucleotide-binding universal stress UspA family protein